MVVVMVCISFVKADTGFSKLEVGAFEYRCQYTVGSFFVSKKCVKYTTSSYGRIEIKLGTHYQRQV